MPLSELNFYVAQAKLRLQERWAAERYPRLADTPPDRGAATDNPYWEIVRLMRHDAQVAYWMDRWAVEWFSSESPSRTLLVNSFAWSIPSPSDLSWMREILAGRDVVEIGAGNGYWAWQLRQLDIEVAAVDNGDRSKEWLQQWSPVAWGDTRTAKEHPQRALMLIWPPYSSPMAHSALENYAGDLLIYAGEGEGGCTADDSFHEALEREWTVISEAPHHPTFDGIHCRLTAYRRAPVCTHSPKED